MAPPRTSAGDLGHRVRDLADGGRARARRWLRATRGRNGPHVDRIERWWQRARLSVAGLRTAGERAERRRNLARAQPRDDGAAASQPLSITTVRLTEPGDRTTNQGIADSPTELVFLTSTDVTLVTVDGLGALAALVEGPAAAVAPTVLHPDRPWRRSTPLDLLVRNAGLMIHVDDRGAVVPRARHAGAPPPDPGPTSAVDAVVAPCLVVRRDAVIAVGGLAGGPNWSAALIDLGCRLRAAGHVLVVTPSVLAIDHRDVDSRRELSEGIDSRRAPWRWVVDRHGPALRRGASSDAGTIHFGISTSAPSRRAAERWGDWHFAHAMGRALERAGHVATVFTADEGDDGALRSCDVAISLRGKAPLRRAPGQRHVIWAISHPELLSDHECDEADLVVVASSRFATALASRTSTTVGVLLQAADTDRFGPRQLTDPPVHPVVVVAKSRGAFRTIVADALAVGIRPAIFGSGWDQFVDASLIAAEHVPNDELADLYARSGVLLNDHWDTMRSWGFVSNRVFDALACGTVIVSDHVPEIPLMFGDAVATYRSRDDLRTEVHAALADLPAARRRAEGGQSVVLDRHTFDDRTRTLLALLAELTPR